MMKILGCSSIEVTNERLRYSHDVKVVITQMSGFIT